MLYISRLKALLNKTALKSRRSLRKVLNERNESMLSLKSLESNIYRRKLDGRPISNRRLERGYQDTKTHSLSEILIGLSENPTRESE